MTVELVAWVLMDDAPFKKSARYHSRALTQVMMPVRARGP